MRFYKDSIAVIFDDHKLFGHSFTKVVENLSLFRSVNYFSVEPEFITFLVDHHKEKIYLFLDYYLDNNNALSLINEAKRLCKNVRIIIVSSVTSPVLISNILTYRPEGFLSKASGFEEVLECVKAIKNNTSFISPIIKKWLDDFKESVDEIPFSSREIEVLNYFSKGLKIEKIAEEMNLSKYTILAHKRNMMSKSKTRSVIELLAYSRSLELI